MKTFYFRFLLFVIVFFVLSFIFQSLIFFCVRKVTVEEWGRRNKLFNGKINADLLIIGESRAFGHYNPAIISNITHITTYNLGGGGSSLSSQIPLLRSYLAHNKKPEIIIFNADYNSLGFEEKVRDPFYDLPYLYDDELYKGRLAIDHNFWIHKVFPASNLYYFNMAKQYELIKGMIRTILHKQDSWISGFHAYEIKIDTNQAVSEIVKQYPDNFNKTLEVRSYSYLLELINLCHKEQIKLLFVASPEYPGATDYQKNRATIMNVYDTLAKLNNFTFIDYTYLFKDKKQLFSGIMHLNQQGAEIFSTKLANDLLVMTPGTDYVK